MNEEIAKQLAQVPCPKCGNHTLTLETRLAARPIGSFSLAGAQMKVSARTVAFLVCPCGFEEEGKVE